jgi:hypothetical protein
MIAGFDHARRLQRSVHVDQPIVLDAVDAVHQRKRVEVAEGVFFEWAVGNLSLLGRSPNRHKVVTHQVIDTRTGRYPDTTAAVLYSAIV